MVYIIAEIGLTHDGSMGQAKALIRAAADCGVNAVKFQTHIASAETLPNAPTPPYFNDESRFEFFERTAFTLEQHSVLKKFASQLGIDFFSSPFSLEAIDLLEKVGVDTYKIPSGEVSNTPLLEKVARTGKKIIISSGMSTWNELDDAIRCLKENGTTDIVLMQCTSEYPCPAESAGMNVMLEMKRRYNLPIGFSDHTIGASIPMLAVALGATYIEKHFTLSKLMYGPDAKNSSTPEEFRELVTGIRDIEKALTHHVDKDQKANQLQKMKITFEKSIVLACEIKKGEIITQKHLAFKKPGNGIPAKEYKDLIGKKCLKDLSANHPFERGDFE